jgi:adenylate kinase family enzyme
MKPDRIAVIGISGSGKSTFAKALAARTGLPAFHGDQLEWMANWMVRPPGDLHARHTRWLAEPRWIIEGWVEPDRAARLGAADLVIDLDYSRWLCAARVLRRMLRNARRSEMPEGCVDRFSWRTLMVVFRKLERPSIDGALRAAAIGEYLRFTSPREAQAWLDTL